VRKARVLLVTPGNPVLEAFFKGKAIGKFADVDRLKPADLEKDVYREKAAGGEYDLAIFDRVAPRAEKDMPRANTFCIDTPPPPWQRGTRELKSPFLIVSKRDHPLLRHITTLWDVGATDAFRFDLRDNLPGPARQEFNLDGKQPGKRAL